MQFGKSSKLIKCRYEGCSSDIELERQGLPPEVLAFSFQQPSGICRPHSCRQRLNGRFKRNVQRHLQLAERRPESRSRNPRTELDSARQKLRFYRRLQPSLQYHKEFRSTYSLSGREFFKFCKFSLQVLCADKFGHTGYRQLAATACKLYGRTSRGGRLPAKNPFIRKASESCSGTSHR